ncbi:MAG: hypothetical protein MI974_15780 [Chitinophagales bacterium]|nr:hypothetical protein [Chitinophagales bacterium]
MEQNELIEKLLSGKLAPEEIKILEEAFGEGKFKSFDFRSLILRIFDLNDGPVQNRSKSDKGLLGFFNKIGRWNKNRRFKKALRKGNSKKNIVAEGDSWFEHPLLVKDIIDWIIKSDRYNVYSIASGGDWIGNILYTGTYITELSLYLPDVFLISGGGNDLVGGNRIAHLIKRRDHVKLEFSDSDEALMDVLQNEGASKKVAKRVIVGRKFLNNDFWALINVFRFQYYLIFLSIRTFASDKFKGMKIITQGYDYPIPSSSKNVFASPLRLIMNNGKWLNVPLGIRRVNNQEEKNCIMTAMIHEYNNMMIDVGSKFEDIYHIDCRELADRKSWIDELHLRSRYYKKIADKYIECIESDNPGRRIFKVYRD